MTCCERTGDTFLIQAMVLIPPPANLATAGTETCWQVWEEVQTLKSLQFLFPGAEEGAPEVQP